MLKEGIAVVDFGGQYAHLIANRIKRLGVYTELVDTDFDFQQEKVKGIILSGGPSSVYEKDAPVISKKNFDIGKPILGICYGNQLIAHLLGGEVKSGRKEYGSATLSIKKNSILLDGLQNEERVWVSHGDSVEKIPEGFEVLASTSDCEYTAVSDKSKNIFGIQFHPEVTHTLSGMKVLENFVFQICKCEKNWDVQDFIESASKEIESDMGRENRAIIALSGGVDSSTAAAIVSKVLGKNLYAVFVDNGLMREDEPEEVKKAFENFGINFILADAREKFLDKLKGITDPEQKRKIIGNEFIRVFEEIANQVNAEYLIQGTIFPDRIESGLSKFSDTIKTHHNVGGLPEKIKFKKIVEPLKDLYKDEVREVARKLGLPESLVNRQPFPGPGLAVRIIGEVTKEKTEILKKADKIVRQEIENAGLNKNLWQYFAILTDTKSTGVKGDERSYGYTAVIRAVESKEAMTASFANLPFEILEKISTQITNKIPEVTRVVYDITHKPPATIEWE